MGCPLENWPGSTIRFKVRYDYCNFWCWLGFYLEFIWRIIDIPPLDYPRLQPLTAGYRHLRHANVLEGDILS
jgi:hypothetical protein